MEDSTELINCNIKSEYLIPKKEAGFHWMRVENIMIIPSDPQHPIHKFRLLCLRAVDYERYWGPKIKGEQQLGFQKAAGFASMELVHDPARNPQTVKIEPIKSAEQIFRENERAKPEYMERQISKHKTKATKE